VRIALIADTFPPLRTSGAVQLRDLSREFVRQGHDLTVILPSSDLERPWAVERVDGFKILRLRAPRTKDINYFRRTAAEFLMPYAMLRNLRKSPLNTQRWDGVAWYAPSIFFGPLIKAVKEQSSCKSYLVIRDIFPEWALDTGLMTRGVPYFFFRAVAKCQYAAADFIGVQTAGNCTYFQEWRTKPGHSLQVLQNWLAEAPEVPCSINVAATQLAGRKIFVYAGNMGVAQGMGALLDLAEQLKHRADLGFLFVGRGSDSKRLAAEAKLRRLGNVLFCDEIDPDEIPNLYKQCHVGLIALDPRHRTHNIPGKFLTYMQSGLPTLAVINAGNDLADLIQVERVGKVNVDRSIAKLVKDAEELIDLAQTDAAIGNRCRSLFARLFSPERAVTQIVDALSPR
jgi:glycosyltransferase involved in cell wall biosynthesis